MYLYILSQMDEETITKMEVILADDSLLQEETVEGEVQVLKETVARGNGKGPDN